MALFAQIDDTGTVTRVIVADQEFIDSGQAGEPSSWIETFEDGSERGNYAGPGFSYDQNRDVFIAPKPHASWTLNDNAKWVSPVARPDDGKTYDWDEAARSWKETPASDLN